MMCETCDRKAAGYLPTPFGRAWRCALCAAQDRRAGYRWSRFVEQAK